VAETWKANKANIPEAQQFDWTYSTPYRGCTTKAGAKWDPEETDEKIDFESLKVYYPLASRLTVLVFITTLSKPPPHTRSLPFLLLPPLSFRSVCAFPPEIVVCIFVLSGSNARVTTFYGLPT